VCSGAFTFSNLSKLLVSCRFFSFDLLSFFFSYFWNILFIFKSQKLEEYTDEKLIQALREIPEIENFEFEFRKYSGENSFNANVMPPIPFILNKYQISFGEELISKFTVDEKVFVLAHEISHTLKKHAAQNFSYFS